MLESLKEQVLEANLDLVRHRVVLFTWGNVSARDRDTGFVVIKPSGVPYERMTADQMVVTDMNGRVIEGSLNPSTDLATHLELYRACPGIGGVVHTHSPHATAWAQAGRDIPFYGTTHADYFNGPIPCTRALTREEIMTDYEKNTGLVLVETFAGTDMTAIPGALVKSHGVFAWGKDAAEAVYHAVVLETVAAMATETERINPDVTPASDDLLEKHYQRKHGKNAYYGQKK